MHVEYWVIVLIILSEKRVQEIMDTRSSWFLNIKSSQTEEHCSECSSGFEKVIVSMFMELIGGLQVILSSDYTHTRHSMWKVYLGWLSRSLPLRLGVLQREPVLHQIWKTTKEPLFRCGQKYVKTCSFRFRYYTLISQKKRNSKNSWFSLTLEHFIKLSKYIRQRCKFQHWPLR